MTDWSNLVRGVDVSHYQRQPDWARVAAVGYAYALIKFCQGGVIDAQFDYNRKGAANNNIPWIPYVFLDSDDTDATVAAFCDAVGLPTFPAALDWETRDLPAAVMERWIDGTASRLNRVPLAYYGLTPPAPLTAAIRQCPRWLPEYPLSPTGNPKLPPWDGQSVVTDWSTCWFIWQWSSAGSVPGVAGYVDLDRLSCPLQVFNEWYASGNLPSAPAPAAGPVTDPPTPTVELAIGRILRLHTTGADVTALQQRLVALGYTIATDGNFGPLTQKAVETFQTAHGLTADGIVGLLTLNALEA